MKKESYWIIALTLVNCLAMAYIETVVEPSYVVKSALKILLFFVLSSLCLKWLHIKIWDHSFALNKKGIIKLLLLGSSIYLMILAAYALTKNIFDYSSLVASLSEDQKVSGNNFIWIALYISFGNSLLEEFLFRFVAFLQLSKYTSRKFAYGFSAMMFAGYHVAMIGASFPLPLLILALIGLAIGGCIFNYVDEKNNIFYHSWVIHMFADFAIMTIWYLYR